MRGASGKPRPRVVVQTDELIRADRSILICPLTSELQADLLTRPLIQPSAGNGLRTASQVMVDRVTPALPWEVGHVVGHLSDDEMLQVGFSLMIVVGLMQHLASSPG